jgi:HEPN domain-containing protein
MTRERVGKAEEDLALARKGRRSKTPVHNGVCFHSQQCAGKYLKGLLEELSLDVPRTHNLDDLLTRLLPHHAALRWLKRGLIFLTRFAVDTRYPGDNATKRQAASALRWAEKVRATARALLSLPLRPPRRKK